MRGGHAVELLIDRADQHLAPESLDGARRLTLFLQPLLHRDFVQIGAPTLAIDGTNRAGDGKFFGEVQERELKKRFREMIGGRQHPGAQHALSAAWFDKENLAGKGDVVFYSKAPVKNPAG